jgi:hypothetical protein
MCWPCQSFIISLAKIINYKFKNLTKNYFQMVNFSNVNKDGKFKMFTNDITSPTIVKFHNAISTGEFSYFH